MRRKNGLSPLPDIPFLPGLCQTLLRHWAPFVGLGGVFLLLCAAQLFLPDLPGIVLILPAGPAGVLFIACIVTMIRAMTPSPGWEYSRSPGSELLRARTVVVDTALVTGGEKEVADLLLPSGPANLTRATPDTLLLLSAMAYTSPLLENKESDALTRHLTSLHMNRDQLVSLKPVCGDTVLGTIPGVVAQDGADRISYFCGDAFDLLALCGSHFDHQAQKITPEERLHLEETLHQFDRRGHRLLGLCCVHPGLNAPGPTYLGTVVLRDRILPDAPDAAKTLQDAGLVVQLQPIDPACPAPLSLSAVRMRLQAPDADYSADVIVSPKALSGTALCIAPADDRHWDFAAPVLRPLEWLRDTRRRASVMTWLLLPLWAICLISGVSPLVWLMICLMALGLHLCLSARTAVTPLALIIPGALGLALTLFLHLAMAPYAVSALSICLICAMLPLLLRMSADRMGTVWLGLMWLAMAGLAIFFFPLPFYTRLFAILGGWLMGMLSTLFCTE